MYKYRYVMAIAVIGALIAVSVAAYWLYTSLPARYGIIPSECTVEITPREPCDFDCDGDCDQDDKDIFDNSIHMCSYNSPMLGFEYNPPADANGDECVDGRDLLLLFPDTGIPEY